MWVYLLLLIVVFILLLISSIYLIRLIHNSLKNIIKNKVLCWIIAIIPVLLLALCFLIDIINVIVIYIHLIIITMLIKLLLLIYRKITKKKKISEYVIIGCSLLITIVYLSFGYYLAHHVIETDYIVYTEKNLGLNNFRIVQISDSHIGTTFSGKDFIKYIDEINKLDPDIVVITGDYVDDNTTYQDMVDATNALGKLITEYGVYFIYGNHDKGYYNKRSYNANDIEKELNNNNVIILEDASMEINDNIIIFGRRDRSDLNRVAAEELTKNVDKNKYIIMLDHEPNDYDNEVKSQTDLVLSGHTHGGQLIPLGQIGLLLGANDSVYGMKSVGKTTFIVNSGISDWAIKFKTGTVSEYTVIDIKNK